MPLRAAGELSPARPSHRSPDAGGTLEERNAAARCVLESCVYSRSGDKLTLIYRLDM